jgi:hypothetical protein
MITTHERTLWRFPLHGGTRISFRANNLSTTCAKLRHELSLLMLLAAVSRNDGTVQAMNLGRVRERTIAEDGNVAVLVIELCLCVVVEAVDRRGICPWIAHNLVLHESRPPLQN